MTVYLTQGLWTFPHSGRDPGAMMIVAYTPTETLLFDYSETQDYYVLAKPPAPVSTPTLFRVGQNYAYQWFKFGQTNLKIVTYPFSLMKAPVTTIYNPPAPIVSSISPTHGSPGGTVTIHGWYFTNTTAVWFNGGKDGPPLSAPATFYSALGDSMIIAGVPELSGTVDITVTTPYGTSSEDEAFGSDEFTYDIIVYGAEDLTTIYSIESSTGLYIPEP